MPVRRQYAASSGVCDAPHLTSSNFNYGPPISQSSNDGHSASRKVASEGPNSHQDLPFHVLCHAAAELHYTQNMGYAFEGAIFRGDIKRHHSTEAKMSQADYQSTNHEAGSSQQTGSYGIIHLSETFEETKLSVRSRTDVEMLARYTKRSPETPLLLPSGAQLQVVTTHVTEAPQVGTGNALENLGSARLNKRRRKQTLSLSTRDNDTGSSDDGARGSKKAKVDGDCDCDTDHSWWMTIKISDLNEVLRRIDAALELAKNLACQSDYLDKIAVGNLIDLLNDSGGILESAKDDMRAEGGRDREAAE